MPRGRLDASINQHGERERIVVAIPCFSQDKITANKTINVIVVLDTKTMTDFTSLHFEWENGCTDGTTVHGLHFSIPNIL